MTVSEVRMRNGWQCGVLCLAERCDGHRDVHDRMAYKEVYHDCQRGEDAEWLAMWCVVPGREV